MVVVDRTEIVGRAKTKSAVVEAVARSNSLNHTGLTNYNEYGVKDGKGFASVTDKFVDNFILEVLVPECNTKNGRNVFVGSENRTIRELLTAHGLEKCIVKAIKFAKIAEPSADMLEFMPNSDKDLESSLYFVQEFKIACPNVHYELVLEFIRNRRYNTCGFFLKDFDVTIDYAGSFDKEELIKHLVGEKGFRLQGDYGDVAVRTIIDNDKLVGRNCLSFMETVDEICTRQKIYNKMVQMLECKSVRSTVGCHWKDWICQTDTRLAKARDKATDRGLTRAEVTFYVERGAIPSDEFIDRTLSRIVEYIPSEMVFSTPFKAVWRAYCDTFKHSLVCIDRSSNIGIVVYSCNELTGNISGQLYENWSDKEKWCLDKLTLNGNLPLDVIDINVITKTSTTVKVRNGTKSARHGEILEITGSRMIKVNPDKSTTFPTRLVSQKGYFSSNNASVEINTTLLEKAGFLVHLNCIPYLAKSRANVKSKANAEFARVEILQVKIEKLKQKVHAGVLTQQIMDEAQRIDGLCHPLLLELSKTEEKLKLINTYTKRFSGRNTTPLNFMEMGTYSVEAARKQNTRYGPSYRMLVDIDGEKMLVWANSSINQVLDRLVEEKGDLVLDLDSRFLAIYNKPLGNLTITGRRLNAYGHTTVCCTLDLSEIGDDSSISKIKKLTEAQIAKCNEDILQSTASRSGVVVIMPRDHLVPYKEYKNLATLAIGSVHKIEAIGYILHYGTERMVVKLEGNIYQAGEDLRGKVEEITNSCYIKILKIRTDIKRRVKFAVCQVFKHGNWSALVDYSKTSIFSKFDGKTCIIDVKTVEHKNNKRKLLLTDKGEVFKLKKSRIEDEIKPGYY